MTFIETQLLKFKTIIENAIKTDGVKGKERAIRSSELINLIHEAVKNEFILQRINPKNIYPPIGEKSPEIKMAGLLKQKDQDICVIPSNIEKEPSIISWGPLAFLNRLDPYGYEFSRNTLVINVRSQMSSLAKNADTLFERTFAEAMNLHMKYPDIVLGEVYLIPLYEYDEELVKQRKVGFKKNPTNVARYISFFNSINERKLNGQPYEYERCALLIVDFSLQTPHLFKNSQELKEAGYLSPEFEIEYEKLSYHNFVKKLLDTYKERFVISNLL